MKIVLMTDMEAVAGVLDHDNWVMLDGAFYMQGRRLLTLEVNAAITGLADGGADEFIVLDGHGQGGIDPELLDERAELRRGHSDETWPWGLDDTVDALGFIGQHAKAGTPYSHITHTGWFNFIDISVNDVSIGEYGQLALCAMELGIPTILACGEQALADEAAALTPGVITVAVKRGLHPDGLAHLDTTAYRAAKLGAIHLHPKRAREAIRKGAQKAIATLKNNPDTFAYPKMKPPYVRTAVFRDNGEDHGAHEARDEHPDSIAALLNMPFTPVE